MTRMDTYTEDHYLYKFVGESIITYRNDSMHDMVYVGEEKIGKYNEMLSTIKTKYSWDDSSIQRLEALISAYRTYHRERAIDQILE